MNLTSEKSLSEVWTSGIVDKTLTPCSGDLTINWCGSNQTQIAPFWWQGKVLGLDESAVSKAVSLQGSALKVVGADVKLPFLCKVCYKIIFDPYFKTLYF